MKEGETFNNFILLGYLFTNFQLMSTKQLIREGLKNGLLFALLQHFWVLSICVCCSSIGLPLGLLDLSRSELRLFCFLSLIFLHHLLGRIILLWKKKVTRRKYPQKLHSSIMQTILILSMRIIVYRQNDKTINHYHNYIITNKLAWNYKHHYINFI